MNILIDHGAYANLGDIAMLEGTVAQLHHALPGARLHVVHRDIPTQLWDNAYAPLVPDYEVEPAYQKIAQPLLRDKSRSLAVRLALAQLALGASAASLPVTTRTGTVSALEFCAPYDALHIGGGGMLNDVFPEQLLRKCRLILTFAAQGKPIVLTGQQLGPFKNTLFKRTLFRALRRANFVGLREPTGSVALCQQANLASAQFAVMGDDSFGTPNPDPTQALALLSSFSLRPQEYIALNLRIARHYAPEFGQYPAFVGALAEKIAQALNLPILFVPIDLDRAHGDIPAARRVIAHMPNTRAIILDHPDLNVALCQSVLGMARGAVGASYHFCMFALRQATPTVNIYKGRYYSQKGQGLTSFWGDSRFALPLNDSDVNAAAQHILAVFNDPALRDQLRQRADTAVHTWQTIFDRETQKYFDTQK